jgi:glycosyltransferase involved in cell wall biosynthesis
MSVFRLVIYTDLSYRVNHGSVTAQLPFALFINALASQGLQVTVAGRLDRESDEPYPFALNPAIHFIGLPSYGSLAHPVAVGRAMLRTMQRFAKETAGADAVWLFGPHPFALGFAAIATRRGQPVVLGVRQNLPALIARRRPKQRWMRWSARLLEFTYRVLSRRFATVVVGPDLAKTYRSARRLLNLPISLISETQIADAETIGKRSYDKDLVAISVGRLDPEKNPLLLADVMAELRSRDSRWTLEIYGQGSLADELTDRLQQLNLAPYVKLRGFLPVDGGLLDVYRKSHALLHVSWTEGVPQVLFEAFAAGLPVVATAVGGVEEAAGDAAVLVPPGDATSPARALNSLGQDPDRRNALISAGLERVTDFTLEKQASRAIAFVTAEQRPAD